MAEQEQYVVLTDPMADYVQQRCDVMSNLARNLTRVWYRLYRSMGFVAVDALSMAKHSLKDVTVDMSVNFDGPMQ